MNKNCKMTIGAMLLLTTAFSVAEVRAQTCVVPPTCEGLGYDKTASDCSGLAKLRCPFDDSKYFCTAYLNPDGSSPATVGDIVYSDGTYSSPEFNYPTKTPVGVVFSNNGGYFVALDTYGSFNEDSKLSCSEYTTGAKNWSVPTETQLKEMYNNKTKLNATMSLLAGVAIEGKYLYKTGNNYVYYVNTSTGSSSWDLRGSGTTRCVNSIGNIQPGEETPTPTTYKVGDTYMKDGIALGKVVEVDSSGQHGILAVAMGQGDASTANSVCIAKTNGGLNWGLATGKHACTLVQNAGSYTDYYSSPDEMTCGIHSASGSGACQNSKYHTAPIRTNCESTNMLGYVCAAVFQMNFCFWPPPQ